jgi:hypothetical protein
MKMHIEMFWIECKNVAASEQEIFQVSYKV